MTDESASPTESQQPPRWQPLGPIDRRVVGVLVEKAKTVPSAYPMSLNAICTAASQKNNRHPLMELAPEDAEESLERLRNLGAVGLIQGYGRVAKYRHYLYEWMGVDKAEIAVMAELLLRGAQTEGELRARAARMEPIADLTALRSILDSLASKRLVEWLTPEGRGRVVSHTLFKPREIENLRTHYASASVAATDTSQEAADLPNVPRQSTGQSFVGAAAVRPEAHFEEASPTPGSQLQLEVDELRSQVAQLRADVDEMTAQVHRTADDLQRLRNELGA